MSRRTAALLAASASVLAGLSLALAPPASATVSTTPASWTPQVTSSNSTVRQLVQCGNTMFAVGAFTTVAQGGKTYTRNNAFSFNATTGALTSWNPNPSAGVNSVALNSTCTTAYLGGGFSTVSGTAAKGIVSLNATTGAVNTGFKHSTSGAVNHVELVNAGKELLVGGNFTALNGTSRAYFASLNPTTGSVDNYANFAVSGTYGGTSGGTKIYNMQISRSGAHALLEGIFTSFGGVAHQQMVELDLGSTSATLNPWSNSSLNTTSCSSSELFYERGGAFSPDESTIYGAATGYVGSSPFCDAITAFTNNAAGTVKWINKTGGDSLYTAAAGPNDVYIGGHERWANNPFGSDSCGPGCVSRPGVGDISATTGQATSWNPTRSRGQGADDLLITSAGLWIASDTYFSSTMCGGKYHPGICFLPGTA